MSQPNVTLTHPQLEAEIIVPESAVHIHERSGWSRKAPAKAKAEKAPATKKAASPAPTNPNTSNGPTAGEES